MFTVYILQNNVNNNYYYGYTERTAQERLSEHNEGKSLYTKKLRPWRMAWFASFENKKTAQEFEKYLKTPSGHAFSRKRLL